jgi:hypothetical protein
MQDKPIVSTLTLLKLAKSNPGKTVEASFRRGLLNSTHFFEWHDGKLLSGWNPQEKLDIDEFLKTYDNFEWIVDQVC